MKTRLIIITVLLVFNKLQAQDIHFSQFNTTSTQLDPSQTGKFRGTQRAIINYKNQWSSVASPYVTYGASFDSKIGRKENFFAAGFNIFNDKAGDIKMGVFLMNALVAYHIKLSKNSYLSTGFQGGFLQRSVDPSKMIYDNQFDGNNYNPSLNSGEIISNSSFINPDFSAGISYLYKSKTGNNVVMNNGFRGSEINVGLAVHHINRPTLSYLNSNIEKQAMKYVLFFNSSFGLPGEVMAIQPMGFMSYQQGAYDYVFGSYLRYTLKEKSKFTTFSNGASYKIGAFYRTADALILSTVLEMSYFALGVSYDINLSGLTAASNGRGGIEFSLKFVYPNPYQARVSLPRM
jgi:type IX secretion system PorP/SprF family membrane protein